ncbi:MarR family winged helix-turn-helix transcriptional regulator [Mycobacterium sp. SMC-4]|uniref:MarR family winged helix-turn-helix transcriptional regulator n=1 Tax=Mycobacterium sp. SMC-4 TaxID=2857059 RepID=UPI0021B3F0A4|nr:MarR family winged helix-turn-helix transcriptional regulator [Mycobacterium sp. SMC-4]UXA17980.1 MarR family winged helix-turn-helix transcriptional regulator [Mycobacterium sp. SMC-4]
MCYAYLVPPSPLDALDDLLTRIHIARLRPNWRRRLLDAAGPVSTMSALRVLRAVEQCENAGAGASVRDVADFLGVEQSTASRTVATVVDAGLLDKTMATDDQRRCRLLLTESGRAALAEVTDRRRDLVAEAVADWPHADVATLVSLLQRLAERFETAAPSR